MTAVADVSLRVAAGARFGIIGPNGAGKTTLFNLLSGELRPTAGSVALFGRDIAALAVAAGQPSAWGAPSRSRASSATSPCSRT